MQLLGDAGNVVGGSLEGAPFEESLLTILVPAMADEASVRFVDRADHAVCVLRRTEDGSVQRVPDASTPLAALSQFALDTGVIAIAENDAAHYPRQVALPLRMYERTMAALAVARHRSTPGYSPEERELLRLIAERAAVALDNRRLFRELQERDRRKDEFLAMLSHELRNPLGAIRAASHVLELVGMTDDIAMRASQVVSRQSAYLTRMMDDLLDVSRVTTGRISLTREVL